MPLPAVVLPALFASIGIFLIRYGPLIVMYILSGIGIGFATYKGSGFILDQIEEQLITKFSGLPENVMCIYSSLAVDQFVSTILTGMAMGLTIRASLQTFRMVKLKQSS